MPRPPVTPSRSLRSAWSAAVRDVHGGPGDSADGEFPVDPGVHRAPDRAGLRPLGHRKIVGGDAAANAVPRSGSTRSSRTTSTVSRPGRRWRCSSSGSGHGRQRERGVEGREYITGPGRHRQHVHSLFIFLVADSAIQSFLSLHAINDPNNQNDIPYFFAQQTRGRRWRTSWCSRSCPPPSPLPRPPCCRRAGSPTRCHGTAFSPKRSGSPQTWTSSVGWDHHLSGLAIIVIVLTVAFDNVGSVFANLIPDIGLLVALYYGITGIACAWAFRKVRLTSPSWFIFARRAALRRRGVPHPDRHALSRRSRCPSASHRLGEEPARSSSPSRSEYPW